MKTIGLIGGMSWESSIVYYELINKKVRKMLGGHHSCQNLMYTVDFDHIVKLQHEDKWSELDIIMVDAARRLEAGTLQSSRTISDVLEQRSPILSSGLPKEKPGVSASTTMALIPPFPFSGSVTAIMTKTSPI